MMRSGGRFLACAILAASAPAVSAGAQSRPDFNGVWRIVDPGRALAPLDGKPLPLKPAAQKVYAANQRKVRAGDLSFDPTAKCVAPGMPRILTLPYPFEIVQGRRKVAFLFQWNYWNRQVDLTARERDVQYPLSDGFAKGTFSGDTLTIDTIGRRADNTLLDSMGMPNSEALHLVEQLRLTDDSQTLEDRITIDDPQTFTRPWTTIVKFRRQPAGTEIPEDVCLDRLEAAKPAVAWPGN